MKRKLVAVLALAFLAALPVWSQGLPTGTLNGRVSDADGAVLPGVTVTASSAALQGVRTAVTGGSGDYNIPQLPPGDYSVTFELEGYATAERTVRVASAQTTPLNHELTVDAITESVTVTGTLETISSQPQVATTFSKEVVEALPINRDMRDTVLLTPGVSASGPGGNIVISGAQSYENLFLVNGVVVNENLRGQPFALFIEDAIEETTTTTAGVSAEYGRFAGGVINTITKSGGNDFHGSLRTSFTNQDWVAETPLTTSRSDVVNERYEATLGGRIIRDKAWFFLAARDFEDLQTRQTTATNVSFPLGTKEKRYEGKLTLTPFEGHRLVGSYQEIENDDLGNFFGTILDTRSVNDRSLPQDLLSVNYTGVITENFFIEGQYSERHFTFENSGSKFTDIINGTLLVDGPTGRRYWSPTFCGVCRPEGRDNENIVAKLSYFLSSESLGSHELIGGYDTFDDIRTADNHQSGSDFRVIVSNTIIRGTDVFPVLVSGNAATFIQWNPILVSSEGTHFKTNSLFLNDRWRLNDKLSFNVGVRYDENDGKNSQGQSTAKDSKISPRLSATYDLKGDGDWIFNASYGEYVSAIANNQADATSQGGNPAALTFFYRGPSINTGSTLIPSDQALRILFDWFNSVGGTNTTDPLIIRSVNIPGATTVIGGGSLDSPSTVEYSVGISKRLGNRGVVRGDYVRREGTDFYYDRLDLSTGTVLVNGRAVNRAVIENTNSALSREYNGLHTQFRFRVSDRLDLGGNYTLSRTQGNVNGETQANGPVRFDGTFPEYKERRWNAPDGDLATDQRHRGRIYGIYKIFNGEHHKLGVSLLETYTTGGPYGAAANINPSAFVDNPGYVSPEPTAVTYFFTDRDAFRTDDITSTDLSINYSFLWNAFGQQVEIFLQPEVLNAFNEDGVLRFSAGTGEGAINTTVLTASNAGSGLTPFNPFTTTPVEGVHWRKGPDFGKPVNSFSFQTPRTYRFSVGIRF